LSAVRKSTSFFYKIVNKMITKTELLDFCSAQFGRLGAGVQRHPWTIIVVSSLVAIIFAMGAGNVNLETEGGEFQGEEELR